MKTKIWKKFLAGFLVVCVLSGSIPVSARPVCRSERPAAVSARQQNEQSEVSTAKIKRIKLLFNKNKAKISDKDSGMISHSRNYKGWGSAKYVAGKNIVVSIYASDSKRVWDTDNKKDLLTIMNTQLYLGVAVKYLQKTCKQYGKNGSKFYYDWISRDGVGDDLCYEARIKGSVFKNDYEKIEKYIKNNIPVKKLQKKYKTNSIIFMVFIDTPKSWKDVSYTYSNVDKEGIGHEMCLIQTHCEGQEEGPAAYAHEMLHTFGAPDLYDLGGDPHGRKLTDSIAAKYISHHPNELMYTCFDQYTQETHYDKITNKVTDLTAYYVGLLKSCSFVKKYHLAKNQYN